ncbi:MAG: molybdopterin molybdotransferase MoeA [Pseudomonadota bacterium]
MSPIQVTQADAIIAEHIAPRESDSVALDDAVGMVLRQQVFAERDQPPFHRVTMDGIALAFDGTRTQEEFMVQSVQHAGDPKHTLKDPQHCIEIMTGAQLPDGCDCVIPIEVYQKKEGKIRLNSDYEPRLMGNIHPKGSDRKKDEALLQPGIQINAPEMAILASAGLPQVNVSKDLSIAILSTGTELVEVDAPIENYQIRRSNDRALATSLQKAGFRRITRHHLLDDPVQLEEKISSLLDSNDFLIVSGGVSKGVKDFVPGILANLGVVKHFHRVAQRPGKPLWFGTTTNNKTVFGLPGNPVSSLVCLVRYVIPACRRSLGLGAAPETWVTLMDSVQFEPSLAWFLPVTLTGDEQGFRAKPRITNTSGDFVSLAGTHGFVELEATTNHFPAGHRARFFGW